MFLMLKNLTGSFQQRIVDVLGKNLCLANSLPLINEMAEVVAFAIRTNETLS